ncbi:hypothetical protein [Pseudomonas sp. PDM25]|uniref:hypothetical protein n=1 Tax=Pseudomonas sp. PDM25 TaxID=2854772 RepID=UPI001C45B15E|nr:hypothetical protein [Pseudomonas sp. PDM25]MBV7515707.1 hypothetical protein [Pseudomonas sp. PDM25]
MTERELDAPLIPKADNGVLDLGGTQENVIEVIIKPYDEINKGDKITVRFDGLGGQGTFLRYAYVTDADLFFAGKDIQIRPLSVFSNGPFNVTYTVESRAANISSSKPLGITINNAPDAEVNVQYHQATYSGFYLEGLIDSWIVPFDYAISKNSDVLISPLSTQAEQGNPTLILSKRTQASGTSSAVGTLAYTLGKWAFIISDSPITLKKGDELSLAMISDGNLDLAVTV